MPIVLNSQPKQLAKVMPQLQLNVNGRVMENAMLLNLNLVQMQLDSLTYVIHNTVSWMVPHVLKELVLTLPLKHCAQPSQK
jgi:hypothetical protein